MPKIYVYSTLTNDHLYTTWKSGAHKSAPNEIIEQVLIKGGANNATKNLITPKGVVTVVTEDQYNHLTNNTVFKKHLKQGLVLVRNDKIDPDDAAKDGMAPKDPSAPLTPTDDRFGRSNGPTPMVEKKSIGEKIRNMIE